MERQAVITVVADALIARRGPHPLRVGIDGPCGAGKTTFANELMEVIAAAGVPVIRLDSDGFHNTKAVRYRHGRDSARGYYADAYDFTALRERVLYPLGPDGNRIYATKVHDMASDEVVVDASARADDSAIMIFDCTFLQRGDLRDAWDVVIYLDVSESVATARGVARDASALGGAPAAASAYEQRYMAACRIYAAEESPCTRADIVIEHNDPARPVITRPQPLHACPIQPATRDR